VMLLDRDRTAGYSAFRRVSDFSQIQLP
jgi:hypothetical protein